MYLSKMLGKFRCKNLLFENFGMALAPQPSMWFCPLFNIVLHELEYTFFLLIIQLL